MSYTRLTVVGRGYDSLRPRVVSYDYASRLITNGEVQLGKFGERKVEKSGVVSVSLVTYFIPSFVW